MRCLLKATNSSVKCIDLLPLITISYADKVGSMLCVTNRTTSTKEILRNYRTRNPTETNYECNIWEAASATAAAPIYFKHVTFLGDEWVDGGLRRNNPINEALAEVSREREWNGKDLGCVLSLGTGVPKLKDVSPNLTGFLKGAVDIMTDSEAVAKDFAASKEGKLLAESQRYFRFSVPQGLQDMEMDDHEESTQMRAFTRDYINYHDIGHRVQQCARSLYEPDMNCKSSHLHRIKDMLINVSIVNPGDSSKHSLLCSVYDMDER